ncbi:serine/threonine-protein kinase [Roseibacillus persicicus]|nr:serine/threonine-protein kinase [Roseibacillus persicicus]
MPARPEICPRCQQAVPLEVEGLCPWCTMAALAALSKKEESPGLSDSAPSIDGLTVHEEVGEGGFGIVYRATQVGLVQRKVALKVLKPGVDTRHVLRRFAAEQKALALLEHPYIARIYQAGSTSDGYPYFTMEFIEGRPITEALHGADWRKILEVFLKVCDAIDYAHGQGLIHRDLKPSNLLVTTSGQPKVIDFGLAKVVDPTREVGMTLYTLAEKSLGTPGYMAPEQKVEGGLVDERSDLYSLGAILFELLTGTTLPENRVPPPSTLTLQQFPLAFDEVVAKAIALTPEQRYQTVEELAVDLKRIELGEPLGIQSAKSHKTKKSALALAAILIAFTCLLAFFWPGERERPRAIPLPTPLTEPSIIFENVTKTPLEILTTPDGRYGLALFRSGGRAIFFDAQTGEEIGTILPLPSAPFSGSIGVDGRRFLVGLNDGTFRNYEASSSKPLSAPFNLTPGYPGRVDRISQYRSTSGEVHILSTSGDKRLRIWNSNLQEVSSLPLIDSPYGLAVHPKGTQALVGSLGGQLNWIDLEKQEVIGVLKGISSHPLSIQYSPDGRLFAVCSDRGQIRVWTETGDVHQVFRLPERVEGFSFSPDSRLLAATCHDGWVRLWNLASGVLLHRFPHDHEVLCVAFSPDGKLLASGGQDFMVRLWEVESGRPAREPWRVNSAVSKMRFVERLDEGCNLAVLTWERAVRLYPVRPEDLDPRPES